MKNAAAVVKELLGALKRRGIGRVIEILDRIEEPESRRKVEEYIDRVKPDRRQNHDEVAKKQALS